MSVSKSIGKIRFLVGSVTAGAQRVLGFRNFAGLQTCSALPA